MPRRHGLALLGCLAVACAALAGNRAVAEPSERQQIEAIQKQLRQLQLQLRALQRQQAAHEAAARAARAEAVRARAAARQAQEAAERRAINPFPPPPAATAAASAATPAVPSDYSAAEGGISPHPTIRLGPVTLSLGGWVELDSIARIRNETADINSSWTAIPLNNVPAGHESEERLSARRSRLAALIEGFPNRTSAVRAYFEADFLGAASTSNSVQSNSYTPRLRQAYATYDRLDWGFHVLLGQAWSLATQNKIGIVPREENTPITIDQGYAPGFVYTRTPQIRLTQDLFQRKLWLGISLENPQTTFAVGPNGTGVPDGDSVNFANPGGSQLNPTVSYSTDVAPDLILKVAADPGFGHYELFGIGKLIRTRVESPGAGAEHVAFAGGIGGSFIVPLLPGGNLELQGSVLAGKGIGRYGISQLPDATIGPNGAPLPIPEVAALIGVIARPVRTVDIYAYVGTERESPRAFAVNGTGFGYGSPLYSNEGCDIEFSTLPCTANTSALTGGVLGFWWRFLHGGFGTMMAGASYTYVRRNVFPGIGGAPYANEQVFLGAFRYYPFE